MTRLRARCRGGRRIHEATPGGHWKIMTILSAMSLDGMIATMTIEEPTDSDIFLAYVEHVLCPKLEPGHVVVMDNLSSHQAEGVCELIEKQGAGELAPLVGVEDFRFFIPGKCFFRVSMQKSVSMGIDSFQASTRRLNQSTTAAR